MVFGYPERSDSHVDELTHIFKYAVSKKCEECSSVCEGVCE